MGKGAQRRLLPLSQAGKFDVFRVLCPTGDNVSGRMEITDLKLIFNGDSSARDSSRVYKRLELRIPSPGLRLSFAFLGILISLLGMDIQTCGGLQTSLVTLP